MHLSPRISCRELCAGQGWQHISWTVACDQTIPVLFRRMEDQTLRLAYPVPVLLRDLSDLHAGELAPSPLFVVVCLQSLPGEVLVLRSQPPFFVRRFQTVIAHLGSCDADELKNTTHPWTKFVMMCNAQFSLGSKKARKFAKNCALGMLRLVHHITHQAQCHASIMEQAHSPCASCWLLPSPTHRLHSALCAAEAAVHSSWTLAASRCSGPGPWLHPSTLLHGSLE